MVPSTSTTSNSKSLLGSKTWAWTLLRTSHSLNASHAWLSSLKLILPSLTPRKTKMLLITKLNKCHLSVQILLFLTPTAWLLNCSRKFSKRLNLPKSAVLLFWWVWSQLLLQLLFLLLILSLQSQVVKVTSLFGTTWKKETLKFMDTLTLEFPELLVTSPRATTKQSQANLRLTATGCTLALHSRLMVTSLSFANQMEKSRYLTWRPLSSKNTSSNWRFLTTRTIPTRALLITTSSKSKCARTVLTSPLPTFKGACPFSKKITPTNRVSPTQMRPWNGNSLARLRVTPPILLLFHSVNPLMRMTRCSRDFSPLVEIEGASNMMSEMLDITRHCPCWENSSLRWKPSPLAAFGTLLLTSKKAFCLLPTMSTKLSYGTPQPWLLAVLALALLTVEKSQNLSKLMFSTAKSSCATPLKRRSLASSNFPLTATLIIPWVLSLTLKKSLTFALPTMASGFSPAVEMI